MTWGFPHILQGRSGRVAASYVARESVAVNGEQFHAIAGFVDFADAQQQFAIRHRSGGGHAQQMCDAAEGLGTEQKLACHFRGRH